MRLRNVKGSQEKILENSYTIQTDGTNGEDYKGLWNKNIFKNSEYRDYPVKDYVAMESTIDKDYLISKLSLFCEPNKAKEVRDWENDIHSSLMLKESPDGSDSEILPLDGRLFEIIGDFKNVEDLKELMKRKGLDQDDIVMILKTVAKR